MSGSRWSLERVVNELRQLRAGGEVITYASLRAAGYGALVSAAERHVGSFSRAIKLAGIEPARRLWTRERIVAEIKRLHGHGVELSSEQLMHSGRAGLVQAARKHFGGWRDAVSAAGAPRFKRGRWKTWEQVCDQLRELHRRGARLTIAALEDSGLRDLVDAAQAEAGNWNAALARAGVPLVQEHVAWSAKQVLDGIQALHRDGIALNARMLSERSAGDRKLVKAATSYFGTWQKACRSAISNYKPLFERWTIERLLDELRDRHRARLPMRSTDVAKEAPMLTEAARRLDIPWRDACRRAGIPKSAITRLPSPSTRVRWDEEKIFAELEYAVRSGRPLLTRSFRGSFVTAVLRRYRAWSDAMEAAGWERQYRRDHSAALANRLGGATMRAKPRV